jgi:hypothetical protein
MLPDLPDCSFLSAQKSLQIKHIINNKGNYTEIREIPLHRNFDITRISKLVIKLLIPTATHNIQKCQNTLTTRMVSD